MSKGPSLSSSIPRAPVFGVFDFSHGQFIIQHRTDFDMDPVSIVSLAAACLGLVKACKSVVGTLRNIMEDFESTKLSLLSFTEECEIIKLAWIQVQEWTKQHDIDVQCQGEVLERLQRSVTCGQLVMSALDKDLVKIVSKNSVRISTVLPWNHRLLHDHQHRIRGQIISLQLLLQILTLYVPTRIFLMACD